MAEEVNVDEAINTEAKDSNEIENDPKYEQKTKYYEQQINIDIENINTIENRKKAYKKEFNLQSYTTIFLKETDIFPDDFIKNVRMMQMKLNFYHLR